MDSDGMEALEARLRAASILMTQPGERECVFCYVRRMVDQFGCTGKLRWTGEWRTLRSPRATALERRMGEGGGYCDCEIFTNGWFLDPGECVFDQEIGELVEPLTIPVCRGVRRGSTQSCGLWSPRFRGW